MFRKNKMKNASMPKFSILPPISDDMLPRLCFDDHIQILLKIVLQIDKFYTKEVSFFFYL